MYGLGKQRTVFGEWLDKQGITQLQLEKESDLSRGTISKLCNELNYYPKYSTMIKIQEALKKLNIDYPERSS